MYKPFCFFNKPIKKRFHRLISLCSSIGKSSNLSHGVFPQITHLISMLPTVISQQGSGRTFFLQICSRVFKASDAEQKFHLAKTTLNYQRNGIPLEPIPRSKEETILTRKGYVQWLRRVGVRFYSPTLWSFPKTKKKNYCLSWLLF